MPRVTIRFLYIIETEHGEIFKGFIKAETEIEARRKIVNKNDFPHRIIGVLLDE